MWVGSLGVIDSCEELRVAWLLLLIADRVEGWRVIALKLVAGLLNLQIYARVQRRLIQLAQLLYRHLCLGGWSGEEYHCWKYILCSEFRVNNNSVCWTQ